jgi:hypothetical protein
LLGKALLDKVTEGIEVEILRICPKDDNSVLLSSLLDSQLRFDLRSAHGSPLLEALPAKNRAPLRWPERNCSFFAALRTVGSCLRAHLAPASAPFSPLCLTAFTSLGFVLKALVGEEHLLAGRENELRTTFGTLQDLIVIFHEPLSP